MGVVVTGRSRYDLNGLRLPQIPVRTMRELLPRGAVGAAVTMGLGDRVLRPREAFRDADLVHTEELGWWFSGQAARLKPTAGFRLVVTVWETLPLLDAYRDRQARRFRAATLDTADLFLAATERARDGLLLEGVSPDRIVVAYPGVDVERFAAGAAQAPTVEDYLIVSPGRLEWEKGHHDLLRAVAALRRGLVPLPPGVADRLRVVIVGSGPEHGRLLRHGAELDIGDALEIRSVAYDDMPSVYAGASAMVLASLPRSGCSLWPGDVPRCFWEEQFGLVLAEAMAAQLPLVLSRSGAIPEVAGDTAAYFPPGDWMAMARALAEGPLSGPPAQRVAHGPERVRLYSSEAAAERLAAAYQRVLT